MEPAPRDAGLMWRVYFRGRGAIKAAIKHFVQLIGGVCECVCVGVCVYVAGTFPYIFFSFTVLFVFMESFVYVFRFLYVAILKKHN